MRCPPRLLNIQLEAVFEQRMDALESELLYSLQDAIHEPKRGQWLSVFFATFLFMVSLEKDSWNLGSWGIELQRAGGSQWPLGTSAPGPEVHGEQNQTLANMLGTVFQVRCQGSVPLKLNWDSAGVKKLVENDEQKVAFLKSLADLISNEGRPLTRLNLSWATLISTRSSGDAGGQEKGCVRSQRQEQLGADVCFQAAPGLISGA